MKQGFTLIELMVVIFIVILLVSGSVMVLSTSRNQRQVKTTAEKIKYVITEAIAQAKTPDDTKFGLKKIEIDVYPHDSATTALQNQVKVYNCLANPCTGANRELNTKLSFKADKGIYLNTGEQNASGNMRQDDNDPMTPMKFFCFDISADGINLGQVIGRVPGFKVFLKVADTTAFGVNDTVYKVIANPNGLVTSEKVP